MKTNWRSYFYFPKPQRKGIWVLFCLCLLILYAPRTFLNFFQKQKTDFSEFKKEIDVFEKEMIISKEEKPKIEKEIIKPIPKLFTFNPNHVTKVELLQLGLSPSVANTFINFRKTGFTFFKKEDIKKIYGIEEPDYERLSPYIYFPKKKEKLIEKEVINKLSPFSFNPNAATKANFLALGLSPKIVQTILNFRAKGGKFWKKEDFRKIYGLSIKDYSTLEPYIDIPKSPPLSFENNKLPKYIPKSYAKPEIIKIDINKGNVKEWQKLNGIGEITAKRIVNFRDKLGGFNSIEQIKATYNVPDSVIEKVKNHLIISPIQNKIAINTITADQLKLHPYIETRQAYIIINYRTNHGKYASIEDLKKIIALKPTFIELIEPYLSFE